MGVPNIRSAAWEDVEQDSAASQEMTNLMKAAGRAIKIAGVKNTGVYRRITEANSATIMRSPASSGSISIGSNTGFSGRS